VTGYPDIMADVARMVAIGDRRRTDRANRAWSILRPFERRILREAAVMGYVLGYRSGNLDGRSGFGGPLDRNNPIPDDVDIIRSVVQHCDSSEGFAYLTDACDGLRRRVTRKRMYPGEAAAR